MLTTILQFLNLVIPEIGAVVVMIKGQSSTSAVVYLDQADTQFAANQQQVADWLKAHGKTPTPGA